MDTYLYYTLLLSAISTILPCHSLKYHLVTDGKNWTEAQSYCRQNYTDLVTINSSLDNELVNNTITENSWIGLRNTGNWTWSDGRDSNFTNWNTSQPDNPVPACAEMYKASSNPPGFWNDADCSYSTSPFVCYHDELFLIQKNMTWFEALAYCRSNYTDLVSVLTESIQYWVSRHAQQASSPLVWIGLRYTCTLDYWFWVNGNSTCYQNWAPNNGGGWEECGSNGAVQRDGEHQWFTMNEMEKFNFICSNSSDY